MTFGRRAPRYRDATKDVCVVRFRFIVVTVRPQSASDVGRGLEDAQARAKHGGCRGEGPTVG
jgi:hypothetical protein